MTKIKRILYISGGILHRGGVESFMMNYYRHFDHSKLQVDFIVHGPEKGYYDDEILSLGGKIYHVPVKSIDYRGNINALRKIFVSGEYNVIHSHMDAMSYVPLQLAKEMGIPNRIAHSHNTNFLTNNPLKILLNKYARFKLRSCATHYQACSVLAGEWLFGKGLMKSQKVTLVNNAIELAKFQFMPEIRAQMRTELSIESNFVIGHVARFDDQKNHEFLIDIFSEIIKKNKKAKLVLVGEGYLKNNIEKKVKTLLLENHVLFLGSRPDVDQLLNAFDVFVLPSKFEGLPVCLIEAQANGLPILVSDVVSKEVAITDLVSFKSLQDANSWIEGILNAQRKETLYYDQISEKGYNIDLESHKLQDFYLGL